MNQQPTFDSLAKMIDHSMLHPTVTDEDIAAGCELSKKYNVAAACVKPYSIPLAKELLSESKVAVCGVVAFPHGSNTTAIKVKEAKEAVSAGATEIDMVVNIGKVLGGAWDYVSREIEAINAVVTAHQAILKVIFENDFLEDEHIIKLCEICSTVGVAFAKTSSGYGFVKRDNGMYSYRGATDHHLKLMRERCSEAVEIKAAGGIGTLEDALRVRQLGATRIGASGTEAILEEAKRKGIK
jgi:deoxyribose-phosphate aldolase